MPPPTQKGLRRIQQSRSFGGNSLRRKRAPIKRQSVSVRGRRSEGFEFDVDQGGEIFHFHFRRFGFGLPPENSECGLAVNRRREPTAAEWMNLGRRKIESAV